LQEIKAIELQIENSLQEKVRLFERLEAIQKLLDRGIVRRG
jgi:hypothetical protein